MDYLQLLSRIQQVGRSAVGGGGGGGGRAGPATQREKSDAMLAESELYLSLIFGGFLATEQGRELLMSEAAAQLLIVFVLSLASFIFLALILRIDFNGLTITYIGDYTAFLRVMIFMSLIGTFMHDKLPWIAYTQLLFLPLLLVQALAGHRAAGGGDDGRAHAARRRTSDTMLAKAEQIMKPVVGAFMITEEGRKVMMSEAAAQHQMVLALSTAGLNILALISRFDFPGFLSPYIDDCSAILKATMLMSLTGTFMCNKLLPWITYIPVLLFVLLLVVRALVHIYKRRGLNNEDIAPPHMD